MAFGFALGGFCCCCLQHQRVLDWMLSAVKVWLKVTPVCEPNFQPMQIHKQSAKSQSHIEESKQRVHKEAIWAKAAGAWNFFAFQKLEGTWLSNRVQAKQASWWMPKMKITNNIAATFQDDSCFEMKPSCNKFAVCAMCTFLKWWQC